MSLPFLDQDGVPTLVEVKRSTDTRIRREVVGQLLDYAANSVAYWPVETIRSRFEARCQDEGKEPDEELEEFLRNDASLDEFWTRVKTNLQASKIRLVFVADQIPRELRRIVEFLNQQMDPAEVLALEVKEFEAEGQKVLQAKLVGQTERKKPGGSRSSRTWTEEAFFESLPLIHHPVARRIQKWAKDGGLPVVWRGDRYGTLVVTLADVTARVLVVGAKGEESFLRIASGRRGGIPLLKDASNREEVIRRLNRIPGVTVPLDAAAPAVPLSALSDESRMSEFLDCMSWIVEQAGDRDA